MIELKLNTGSVDIYYADTKDLISIYTDFKNYASVDEQSRADKFYFKKDRETYILCHAILRLLLAKHMQVKTSEIIYKLGENNKPGIMGDPVYFNITHTREAFAIAVSKNFFVGIDLDDINQDIDIYSVAKSFFSKREFEYVFKSKTGYKDRFILLWTRKEAILKALGTGLLDNLNIIEVSEQGKFIKEYSFYEIRLNYNAQDLFLYSKKIRNNYLTIAIPNEASFHFCQLNSENIHHYLE